MSARSLTLVALLALSALSTSIVACTSEEAAIAASDAADDDSAVADAASDVPDATVDSARDSGGDATLDTGTDVRADTNATDTNVLDTRIGDTSATDTKAPDAILADTASADTIAADTIAADTIAADTTTADTTTADTTTGDTSASDAPPDSAVKCDEFASLELAGWSTGYAAAATVLRATMAPIRWSEASAWLVVMANGPASIEGTSATLGQGANATVAGCTHCVTAEVGCTTTFGETTPVAVECAGKKTLLAVSGTALFSSVPTSAGQMLAGTLTDVTLREVTAESAIVPGGACIHIGTATVRGSTRAITEPASRTVSALFPLLFPNPTAIGGGCSLVASSPCNTTPTTPTCETAPGSSEGICTTSCGSACTAIGRFCATFATDVCVPPCSAIGQCSDNFACANLGGDAGVPSRACIPNGW